MVTAQSGQRTLTGAGATTIAVVLPVFLVGGLAVQIREELRSPPAGLGLAVDFGVSGLAEHVLRPPARSSRSGLKQSAVPVSTLLAGAAVPTVA